jgi:hypothetical protein
MWNDGRYKITCTPCSQSLSSACCLIVVSVSSHLPHLTTLTVEPTGIELHVNRKLKGLDVLSVTVSLDVDVVSGKISVNDILLAHSILSRGRIADSIPENGQNPQSTRGRSSTASSATPVSQVTPISTPSLTVYDFVAQLGSISLVAINDFNGQNLPILRLAIERSDFRAGGQVGDLQGEGSFQVSAEYYNTRVAVWEPLIELWGPSITVVSSASGTVVEALSDNTLQIDVSGAMVKSFSQVLNLTSTIIEELSTQGSSDKSPRSVLSPHTQPVPSIRRASGRKSSLSTVRAMITDKSLARGTDSPVTFRNCLEFPIEVFDSVSKESLMVLRAGDSAPLVSPGSLSRSWIQSQGKYPTLFDVRILGRLKDQRLPLLQLPLNINKPRPYCLQPNLASGPGGLGGVRDSDRSRGTEPIVEEAYENQRYHPVEMGWSTPWSDLNDPPTWTDVLGCGPRNPSSVRLPSDRWEWVERDWKVDMSGVIGVEIDEKGWEYATNFTSFSISKIKRTKMPMDVTRRRRWIRSRMPKSTASDELLRPLTVIWDVKALKDGSRTAEVRSGLQVKNLMPFPLAVAIDGFPGLAPSLAFNLLEEGDQDSLPSLDRVVPFRAGTVGRTGGLSARIFDDIPEGETFSLPLLLSAATMMKFKPSGGQHGWSQSVSCRPNNSSVATVCEGEGSVKDKEKNQTQNPSHFRIMSAPEGTLRSARDLYDLLCPMSGVGKRDTSEPVFSVCIQGLVLTADRSRLVACVPYATCHNLLPCDMSYQFLGGDGNTEQVQYCDWFDIRSALLSESDSLVYLVM